MYTITASVIVAFSLQNAAGDNLIRTITLYRAVIHRQTVDELLVHLRPMHAECMSFVERNNEVLKRLKAQIVVRLSGSEVYPV